MGSVRLKRKQEGRPDRRRNANRPGGREAQGNQPDTAGETFSESTYVRYVEQPHSRRNGGCRGWGEGGASVFNGDRVGAGRWQVLQRDLTVVLVGTAV